jgi:hypothetical protein
MRKCTFMVGRASGRNTLLVFIGLARGPIAGPFTVRAVLSTN